MAPFLGRIGNGGGTTAGFGFGKKRGLRERVLPALVEYLVIGGGGGGSISPGDTGVRGGGGGAGGYLSGSIPSVTNRGFYTITVGAGGPAGTNGGNTDFYPPTVTNPNPEYIRALGGGAGRAGTGSPGGSGGGGSGAGAGTPGQGFPGRGGGSFVPGGTTWGGGGGAGAAATSQTGGIGLQSSITGVLTYYAGGGGGAGYADPGAIPGPQQGALVPQGGGGLGGGGAVGVPGTANTGGGGGFTGSGGSGIVIVRYPLDFDRATTTGTVSRTTNGSFQIYTFTGSGTITF